MMYLERRDIARNMARYYCLTVERNLFGEFSLVRTWGRIGCHGRQKIEIYNPSCHLLKSMGFCLTLTVKSPISPQEESAHGRQNYRDVLSV